MALSPEPSAVEISHSDRCSSRIHSVGRKAALSALLKLAPSIHILSLHNQENFSAQPSSVQLASSLCYMRLL